MLCTKQTGGFQTPFPCPSCCVALLQVLAVGACLTFGWGGGKLAVMQLCARGVLDIPATPDEGLQKSGLLISGLTDDAGALARVSSHGNQLSSMMPSAKALPAADVLEGPFKTNGSLIAGIRNLSVRSWLGPADGLKVTQLDWRGRPLGALVRA